MMDKALPSAELTDRDRSITMIGILTAMLLAALDQSIVTPAMPTIGGALGHAEYLPWIVTAYLLTATAAAPLYGKISDIYGRRSTLYAALGLFLLGSLMAALAPNLFVLIAARAVQGMGGGGLFALSQILIGDLLPPRERGRYAAWISGMWAVAGIAGPLLGGTLAEYAWSLIFWINLPLGAIAFLVIDQPLKKLATRPRAHRLDISGAVLLVVATSVLLLVLNWGGISYPWSSPQVLGLLGLSAVFWIAFATRLSRAKEPLVSLEVLSNPIALAGCFGMFMVAAVNVGLSVYLPVYAQAYLGLSPAGSGYALLGFLLGAVAGATLGGRLTLRVVHAKRIAITGAAIGGVALIAAGLLAAEKSLVVVELVMTVTGIGMGMTFPVTTVSVQNAVDQQHLGVATGMLTFLRSLGAALGVAVLGAILLAHAIPLGHGAEGRMFHVDDPWPFAVMYYAMAAIMLVAAVIYAVMPHKELRAQHETGPVASPISTAASR